MSTYFTDLFHKNCSLLIGMTYSCALADEHRFESHQHKLLRGLDRLRAPAIEIATFFDKTCGEKLFNP